MRKESVVDGVGRVILLTLVRGRSCARVGNCGALILGAPGGAGGAGGAGGETGTCTSWSDATVSSEPIVWSYGGLICGVSVVGVLDDGGLGLDGTNDGAGGSCGGSGGLLYGSTGGGSSGGFGEGRGCFSMSGIVMSGSKKSSGQSILVMSLQSSMLSNGSCSRSS